MKPLDKPPEWEGDDSINTPDDLKKKLESLKESDLSDVDDHGDEEDDDDE